LSRKAAKSGIAEEAEEMDDVGLSVEEQILAEAGKPDETPSETPAETPSETPDPQPTEGAGEANDPDYKALYEQSEAARGTLEIEAQRVRSTEIGQLRQADRDRLALQSSQEIKAIATAIANGDGSSLPERMAEIQQEHTVKATEEGFKEQAAAVGAEIAEIGMAMGVSPDSHAAFEQARLYWQNAHRNNDPIALAKALNEGHKAQRKAETDGRDKAVADARQAGRDEVTRRQALEEADVDMGGGGGGSGAGDQEWLNEYADDVNGKIPSTPENRKRANDLMAKGMQPRPRG
jgi:hypothetical protein